MHARIHSLYNTRFYAHAVDVANHGSPVVPNFVLTFSYSYSWLIEYGGRYLNDINLIY